MKIDKIMFDMKEHQRKLKNPEYKHWFKENLINQTKKNWMELKPFVKAEDVPGLPKMEKFFIDKLIELGAIPKRDLEDGVWYYGEYRNAQLGKWDNENKKFGHWRYKFGYRWDICNHFEDDNGYALFVPLRKANVEELKEIKEIENETI